MWLMLQEENPDDYVIGTGEPTRFANSSTSPSRLLTWIGESMLRLTPLFRPAEVDYLCADASKARRILAGTDCNLQGIGPHNDLSRHQGTGGSHQRWAEAIQLAVAAEGRYS